MSKHLFFLHDEYHDRNHLRKQSQVERLQAYGRFLRQRLNVLTSLDSKEPDKFFIFDYCALFKPAIPKRINASYEELHPGGLLSITHYQPTPPQNFTSPVTWDDFLYLFSRPVYSGSDHIIKQLEFLRQQITGSIKAVLRVFSILDNIMVFDRSACINYLKQQIKLIRKEIAALLPKTFPQPRRDLRETFRSIVRFLFKNMDDCSGDSNALKNLTYQPLLIPNYYFHDKQRDHSITQRYSRQQ